MKKIVFILMAVLLIGCTNTSTVKLNNTYTIEFYTIPTCAECIAFKKNAIPYIEKQTNKKVKIIIKDMDDKKVMKEYDQVIKKLKNFDQEYYGMGPFIHVKGYVSYLGYRAGDEKQIVQDIETIDQKKSLPVDKQKHRFEYK